MAGASGAFRLPRPELFGYMRRRSRVRFPPACESLLYMLL